jgi:hypothetical protein
MPTTIYGTAGAEMVTFIELNTGASERHQRRYRSSGLPMARGVVGACATAPFGCIVIAAVTWASLGYSRWG